MTRTWVVAVAALPLISALGCSEKNCTPSGNGGCATTTTDTSGSGSNSGSGGSGGNGGSGSGGSSSSGVGPIEAYGTVPNGGHISLDCTPNQVPAFVYHDCLYSHLRDPEAVKCTMKLADRLGLPIGVATNVSFASEAGVVSPVTTSPAYSDPPDGSKLGHAEGYLEVLGGPLPADVTPMTGELSAVTDFGCGQRTVNPRDGYVTVIAWTRGEEGYVDLNQNGKYDAGEPFVDMGEPFVDANDNGKWDPGEWWLDVDGDGKYTGPNGKWDADTIIWTQTRVVYTGIPFFATDTSSRNLFTRIYDTGSPPAATPQAAQFTVHGGPPPTSVSYGVFFTDQFLNPLDPGTIYAASSASGHVTAALTGPAVPWRTTPSLFRLLYCDKPTFPASCSDGPVEHGCTTSPCFVVPEVALCQTATCSGFQYGEFATLTVTGTTVPGADAANVSATVAKFTTTFSIRGQNLVP